MVRAWISVRFILGLQSEVEKCREVKSRLPRATPIGALAAVVEYDQFFHDLSLLLQYFMEKAT